MEEIWELLDENGDKVGKTVPRSEMPEGFYHLGTDVWFINSKNEILIQKRSPQKRKEPNVWAMTGGSVIKGENSLQTIEREVKEELGINLDMQNIKLIKRYKTGNVWLDTYIVRQDIELKDITMQEEEVCDVKWATFEEIEELFHSQQFMKNRWEYIRDLMQSIQYIGKNVSVTIDRPIGSCHPEYPNSIYPINYGFIPNTINGDGEEIDCYILGEGMPLKEYQGKCIAVIHRMEEDDDKLIVVPKTRDFTEKEIKELTNFQEKYYQSSIIK